jgi:hypothetical protein
MTKRQPTALQSLLRRRKTKTHKRVQLRTDAAEYKITVDPELPRTRKKGNIVISVVAYALKFSHQISDKHHEGWKACKTSPTTPIFRCMDEPYQQKLIADIGKFGNSPSRVVSRHVGLIPRQIGGIRRYYIENWKTRTNKHI